MQPQLGRRRPGGARMRQRVERRQGRVVGGQRVERGDVRVRLRCGVGRLRQQQDRAQLVRGYHRRVLIGEPQRHQRRRPGPGQLARLHGGPDARPGAGAVPGAGGAAPAARRMGAARTGRPGHDLGAGQAEGGGHDAARVLPGRLAGVPGDGPHPAARVQAQLRGGRGAVVAGGVRIEDALDCAVQA